MVEVSCVTHAIAENAFKFQASMAKGMRNLNAWIEVAPAPVIYPRKISNSPTLETILEESVEECDDD
ncbi:unnamed protein product [Malus baccata var. baccata]